MTPVRVLVVDDNAVFLRAVCEHLAQLHGVEVAGSATSADEGMRMIGQLNPDLVLMDLKMPEKNGLEATKQIRREGGRAKIIIMSALSGAIYSRTAMEAGADAFIEKDLLYGGITRLVNSWFRSSLPGSAETAI